MMRFRARDFILIVLVLFFAAVGLTYSPLLNRLPRAQRALLAFREKLYDIPTCVGTVEAAAWSPDAKSMAFSGARYTLGGRKIWSLYLLDMGTRKVTRIAGYAGYDEIARMAFASNGALLAVMFRKASGDSYVELLNLETDTFFPLPLPSHHPLRSVGFADSQLAFMPDGKSLLFTGFDGNRHWLCVYNMESGASRILPIPLDAYGGTWSPTGDRILFLARYGRNVSVMMASKDGSGAAPLYSNGMNCCARYSPFGKEVAFLQRDSLGLSSTLGIVDLTKNRMDFTRGLPTEVGGLGWSSDGNEVFFQARNKGKDWGIYTYSSDSGTLKRVTESGESMEPEANPQRPGFAYIASGALPGFYALYAEDATGANGEKLTGWFFP